MADLGDAESERPAPLRRVAPPFRVAPAGRVPGGAGALVVAPCAALVFRSGFWAPLSPVLSVGAEGLEPPTCCL